MPEASIGAEQACRGPRLKSDIGIEADLGRRSMKVSFWTHSRHQRREIAAVQFAPEPFRKFRILTVIGRTSVGGRAMPLYVIAEL